MVKKSKKKEDESEAPETTPISQKVKKKKKKKDKSLSPKDKSLSPAKRSARRIAAIDSPKSEKEKSSKQIAAILSPKSEKEKSARRISAILSPKSGKHKSPKQIAAILSPKSEKQKSEKSLQRKAKKDKEKDKDKKKKKKKPKNGSKKALISPLISPSSNNDNTSIHSDDPEIENTGNEGNPGPEEVMYSNFGPMDTPDWNDRDENDDMSEDKSMDSADQMMNSIQNPLHDSKISLDGSNVIEDQPPIGELVVEKEYSDHVSEIGEPTSSMHETANGDDRLTPNDNDICFEDRGHPGTRAMTKVIRDLLNENEGTEYSPSICKLLKRKLRGRRFLIKLRRNEETIWKEATKVEITELIGEWFNEERRRKEQGIEDDDSDENSSLQDSGVQSETSMPLEAIITDPQSVPPSSSKRMVNSSMTPKASNTGFFGRNGDSNGFHHSSRTPSGDETAEDLLHSIAEECRNAEEYAHPFKSEDLQKSGRAVEKKLEEILKKMSTLNAHKEGEELIEEMQKMDELIERVKYASIGPLLEMVERIHGNLNAYAETYDETANDSQEPDTKSNGRLLSSNGHDQIQSPRGSKGSKTKGAMRKERTSNGGPDSEVHVNGNFDSNPSNTPKIHANGVSMQADENAPVQNGEIHVPQLSDSEKEDYHEEELKDDGFHDVDEPLKPGSYTETRLKGFDSDADFQESGELSDYDSNDASILVQDLGYEENGVELPAQYTVGLKGSSESLDFNQGDDEQSYSESVSFVTEAEEKPSSEVRSYFEYSMEQEEGSQGSQSLKAEGVFERDEMEGRDPQTGHVIEISAADEMSSVGQSRHGSSMFGFESDEEDDDENNYIETEVVEEYTDEEFSGSDTSDSETRHKRRMVEKDIPNPRLEQFFDRLQHFFEVRRKVEERADMTDPSHKIRKLKVKVTAGGVRKSTGGGFRTEYQQKNGNKDVVKNLDDLYNAAQLTREALMKVLDNLTDEVNGLYNESIEVPDLKPRDRAYGKAKEEYRDRRPGPPESWLYDVARASVICKSYKQMADVNKWLGKNVHIVSSKNRFYEPVFNGYRDLLYHVSLPYRGTLTHICEIQVHHKDIKALDLQYGLPKHYEFFRSCFAGPWRTQEKILEDLVMMNRYGDVGSMMVKLMKSKDPDQLRLFAGLCREKLDEFDKALELYRRILILQQDKLGHDHESVADTHLNMGLVLGAKGQIDESLVHMQKALSIQESVGSDNVDVAALLTEIGRMLSKNGNFEGALIKFEKALEIRESIFGYEHFLVIASLQDIGKAFSDMGDFTAAEVTYRKALKIQEEVLGGVHPDIAATCHMIGTTLCQYGDVSKAMEEHRLALSIRETTLGKNHPMTAESQTDIGIVLCQKGDYEVAEWRHRKALRIRELKGKEDEDCAISLSYLGDVLSRKGEYNGAVKAIKRAQVIREHSLGMDHPITAASYIDLGNVYYKKGDSELALKEFRRARVAREAILGPDHPDTAVAFSCMGNALNLQGDYDGAHKVHSRALKIFEDILGENHPLTATGYQNIADTLLLMGEKEEALIQHRKALAIRANVLSKDHPDTALSCSRIGDLLAEKDDLIGALVAHRQALAITVGLCGEDNADSAKAHIHVGLVLAAQGEFDEALDELDHATGVLEALLGESHEETGRAYSLIGSIHSARGEFDDALNMHSQAFDIFESIYGEDHPKTEAAAVKCRMAEHEEAETEF